MVSRDWWRAGHVTTILPSDWWTAAMLTSDWSRCNVVELNLGTNQLAKIPDDVSLLSR